MNHEFGDVSVQASVSVVLRNLSFILNSSKRISKEGTQDCNWQCLAVLIDQWFLTMFQGLNPTSSKYVLIEPFAVEKYNVVCCSNAKHKTRVVPGSMGTSRVFEFEPLIS